MRVLVVFGSKRGGTQGLAQTVAETLQQAGHEVALKPARELDGLGGWDAVVVGGALYAGRWLRSARRFVERHADELQRMPVWFFSSGPLDDSAARGGIAPTAQVSRLIEKVHARDHVTFGGRLAPDATGFIAKAMVKQGRAGDFRDLAAARTFATQVGKELATLTSGPATGLATAPSRGQRPRRRVLGALCLFTGLTAAGGGLTLMSAPLGSSAGAPGLNVGMLEHSPFIDFFMPGLLLFAAVGLLNLVAATMVLRRHRVGELAAFAAGSSISLWIAGELVFLRHFSWLQIVYGVVGAATLALAFWLWRDRRADVRSHAALMSPPVRA